MDEKIKCLNYRCLIRDVCLRFAKVNQRKGLANWGRFEYSLDGGCAFFIDENKMTQGI